MSFTIRVWKWESFIFFQCQVHLNIIARVNSRLFHLACGGGGMQERRAGRDNS